MTSSGAQLDVLLTLRNNSLHQIQELGKRKL